MGLHHPRFFLAALVRMTMRHNHLEMVLDQPLYTHLPFGPFHMLPCNCPKFSVFGDYPRVAKILTLSYISHLIYWDICRTIV